MSVTGPTIVRRQLGRRLRQARAQAGKTIDDVVASGIVSKATLHRYEGGRVPVTPGTVLELSLLYGLDQTGTKALYDLAVNSQRRGWWEDHEQGGSDPALYVGLESAATRIETFQADVIYGLLQTPDYARAVETADATAPDEPTITQRVSRRIRRQQIFERNPPVELRAVFGEGVLARQIGDSRTMAAQITHLSDMVRRHQVDIRVLTWQAGAHAAMTGAFSLMRYEDPDDPPLVFIETPLGGGYYEHPDQVARCSRMFDSVYQESVPLMDYLA
ncbi:MAG TPA: Scr1 family TA system antitoxin-like transcriptional regulator [Kineosporiaceae bacterium]|nr:Scr1 family TA system antitoxin-like transcriptional regulator [Kineosporiaceae bacterium]